MSTKKSFLFFTPTTIIEGMSNCPCHSKKKYEDCCKPLHLGAPAADGLALMRSRFSAYSLGLPDYIIATTHPKSPFYASDKEQWKKEILEFCHSTDFDNLTIIDHVSLPNLETVTFRAHLTEDVHDISFTEKSTFEKDDGRFKYIQGVML